MFTKAFDRYVCPGDTRHCYIDEVQYTARIEFDCDTKVEDFDCYDDAAAVEWGNDEWFFCTVAVSARTVKQYYGVVASLSGVDANFPGSDNSYLLEVANDLLPEAVAQVDAIRGRAGPPPPPKLATVYLVIEQEFGPGEVGAPIAVYEDEADAEVRAERIREYWRGRGFRVYEDVASGEDDDLAWDYSVFVEARDVIPATRGAPA